MTRTFSRRARLATVAAALVALTAGAVPAATAAGDGDRSGAARLAAASAAVERADVAGTAWHTDAERGTLVVTADRTVDAAETRKIRAAVEHAGGTLELRRVPGTFEPYIAGGDTIIGPGGVRCTVGFNVTDGTAVYALTAGHCAAAGPTWAIGPRWNYSFPGNDYGLIKYDDPSQAEGGVRAGGTFYDIDRAANPMIGQSVCRAGSTTGMHCGSVTGLNATVNYGADGVVYGLIQTNLCAEPGDSGGPLWQGSTGYGITSGGSGNCSTGGTTFFQPVVEVLSAHGLTML
jgi:hypothetical protein